MHLLERVQRRARETIRGVERLPASTGWELGLRGDLRAALQYLRGGRKKEGDRLFNRVCCVRIRRNGFRLKERRLRVDLRKNKVFYTKRGEALAQLTHRGDACLIPGDIRAVGVDDF